MHERPRPSQPAPAGLVSDGVGRVGEEQVLDQEQLMAMNDGGGVSGYAVVRAVLPWREGHLASLAPDQILRELCRLHVVLADEPTNNRCTFDFVQWDPLG